MTRLLLPVFEFRDNAANDRSSHAHAARRRNALAPSSQENLNAGYVGLAAARTRAGEVAIKQYRPWNVKWCRSRLNWMISVFSIAMPQWMIHRAGHARGC